MSKHGTQSIETPQTQTPETTGGTLEDLKNSLKGKIKVFEQVGDKLNELKENFDTMDAMEKFKQWGGIVAVAILGWFANEETVEKFKEKTGIKVTKVKEKVESITEKESDNSQNETEEGQDKKISRNTSKAPRVAVKQGNPEVAKSRKAEALLKEHGENVKKMQLWPGKTEKQVERFKEKLEANRASYEKVSDATDMPAVLIAAIHNMEGSMNFDTYFHNGQKLGTPTKIHPKGILFPKGIEGWAESAIHALGGDIVDHSNPPKESLHYFTQLKKKFGIHKNTTDVAKLAAFAEAYNGYGWRKRGKRSAYVYGGTNLCPQGRYVADKKFDETKVSQRVGVAGLILGAQKKLPVAEKKYILENQDIFDERVS